MRQERCVEQLYPSNKYTIDDIKKELSHKIKFYPKKKADIEITLNENGIYVARISFLFEENLKLRERLKFLNFEKIKENLKIGENEKNSEFEKNSKNVEKISKNSKKIKKCTNLSDKTSKVSYKKINKNKKSVMYSEKINIRTKIKNDMAVKKYMNRENSKEKKKKTKYEKHVEKNIVLRPI